MVKKRVKIGSTIIIIFIFLLNSPPVLKAFATAGDNAFFSFAPLNGKEGENEIKMIVNTDGAAINHLIFDIVNPTDNLVFDMTGTNDPVVFPLSGQSVLGTQTAFTTASGDIGYDLASSNPANTGSYTALNFGILIGDKNLPTGQGGILSYDTDTAIYVNAQRRGSSASSYTILPNTAPQITLPALGGVSLSASTTEPSESSPIPAGLIQNVSINATFTFTATDSTDASVQRKVQIYEKNTNSWTYKTTAAASKISARSGSTMTFSYTPTLDFSKYYKAVFTVMDDQGASSSETYYFSTQADNSAPVQVSKAFMNFIGESDNRVDVISQISFKTTFDNNSVSNYYIWTKDYLKDKNIINADGTRDLFIDTDQNGNISDEEFNIALRQLVWNGYYIKAVSASEITGDTGYFRISGEDVDRYDDNDTPYDTSDDMYLVPNSLTEDVLYISAGDNAKTISGESVPNFSEFQIVNKTGDVFGAEREVSSGSTNFTYIIGDGSLDVWDAIYLYRNIIGRTTEYPILFPDISSDNFFDLPVNLTRSGTR